jgi:hypothetical protein
MMKNTNRNTSPKSYISALSLIHKKKNLVNLFNTAIALLFLTLLFAPFTLVSAQTSATPQPLLPQNGANYVEVTSIQFSWTTVTGASEYKFELSKNINFQSPYVFPATIRNSTAYMFKATLEYKTTYFWRVRAEPLGDWSAVSVFTTKANPASTNNTTAPPKGSTKSSSIISYLEDIGWPIVGVTAAVIVAVVIAFLVLSKPKTPSGGSRQWQPNQPPPFMQQPSTCPTCGSPNTPDRKFCSNCGANLPIRGPQQPFGTPSGQQSIACPTCGFPNNTPDRKFCGNCGANLGNTCQQPPQVSQQQQAYQIYETYSCPVCGSPINKGTNPCPNCHNWLDWGAF